MNLRLIIEWLGVIGATLLFVYTITIGRVQIEARDLMLKGHRASILALQAQVKDLRLQISWLDGRRDRHNNEWNVVLRTLRREIEGP